MSKSKKITGTIKLQIPPGAANPAPPVGPALGQQGVNIMDFCKAFNDDTKEEQKKFPGMKLPVVITVYADRSFTFIKKLPPAAQLLKSAAKVKKGSGLTGQQFIGKIRKSQIEEIAKLKIEDTNANDLAAATKMLVGTAISIGLDVREG